MRSSVGSTLPEQASDFDHAVGERGDLLADRAFARTTGAPLVPGNRVRLLLDAEQNYPAWQQAITSAERTIHFEMYILHNDPTGLAMADLLIDKASQGVHVRLLYDWFGAFGWTSWRLWRRLRRHGVEVRSCNPPRLSQYSRIEPKDSKP